MDFMFNIAALTWDGNNYYFILHAKVLKDLLLYRHCTSCELNYFYISRSICRYDTLPYKNYVWIVLSNASIKY